MQAFRMCQILRRVKETAISEECLFSSACCRRHASRVQVFIIMAAGTLNLDISGSEGWIMRNMNQFIRSLFLAAAFVPPTVATAHATLPRAACRSESTIRSTLMTITRTTMKTAHTGVIWRNSTGVIGRTTSSFTESRGTIGIGATVARIAINEGG
jgi:hypothetical protein